MSPFGKAISMIESVIEWSIRNRFLVILASLLLGVAGVHAMLTTPVNAIPDLSENQVIVFADWMGRSPQEIEDQVTYPLSSKLQGLAGVKVVRSSSEFNFSMITIIFDDRTDYYFARQRVLERLATIAPEMPAGVVPYMAPDATAVGQIFWYTVEGEGNDLGELRSIQDWYVRYQLNECAGCGGGRLRRRCAEGIPDRSRPQQAPGLWHQFGPGRRGRRTVELVCRRSGYPPGESRIPDPIHRLDREARRHPRDRGEPGVGTARRSEWETWAPCRPVRRSAGACSRRTAGRSSVAWS